MTAREKKLAKFPEAGRSLLVFATLDDPSPHAQTHFLNELKKIRTDLILFVDLPQDPEPLATLLAAGPCIVTFEKSAANALDLASQKQISILPASSLQGEIEWGTPLTSTTVDRLIALGGDPVQVMKDYSFVLHPPAHTLSGEGKTTAAPPQELIENVDPALLQSEVDTIKKNRGQTGSRCVRSDEKYDILAIYAQDAPSLMRANTRSREVTFRDNEEGSGQSSDTDPFDAHYLQVIAWDKINKRIAGAYRAGEIFLFHGNSPSRTSNVSGTSGAIDLAMIYTHLEFTVDPNTQTEFHEALELGRSYVIPELQKTAPILKLLLAGIAQVIIDAHYTVDADPESKSVKISSLFGAASAPGTSRALSNYVLMEFIKKHHFAKPTSGSIEPRNPVTLTLTPLEQKIADRVLAVATDLKSLSEMTSAWEPDGRSLPQLFSIYQDMGGVFYGFHYDAEFNSVDGLVRVELSQVPEMTLLRLLGREKANEFLRLFNRPEMPESKRKR